MKKNINFLLTVLILFLTFFQSTVFAQKSVEPIFIIHKVDYHKPYFNGSAKISSETENLVTLSGFIKKFDKTFDISTEAKNDLEKIYDTINFSEETYPVGTYIEIKNSEDIIFASNNSSIRELEPNKVIFTQPGKISFIIYAFFDENKVAKFSKNFNIINNTSLDNLNFNSVPLEQLQNYNLLHQYLNDEELKATYNAALPIAKELSGLKLEEQLKLLTLLIRDYYEKKVTYSTKEPHFLDAYGFLITHKASCQGSTCATGLILNILGIEYEHINHNLWKHQWCRVNVNGTYWIVDPYGLYCGPDIEQYDGDYPNIVRMSGVLTYADEEMTAFIRKQYKESQY